MKVLLILLILFPFVTIAKDKLFVKRLLPMMCLPYAVFAEQQKRVDETAVVFGLIEHSPDVLFELHKNKDENDPSFTVTLRRNDEICMLIAGTQLLPSWWFEERGLLWYDGD